MDKQSEIQMKRCRTYKRNLGIKAMVDGGVSQVLVAKIWGISRQRVFQILQELEKAQENTDYEWSKVRDKYGTEEGNNGD